MNTITGQAGGAGQLAGAGLWRYSEVPLAAAFAAVHLLMFAYDLAYPGRFLNADRADARIAVIQQFVQTWQGGGDLGAFLASHGIAGDWLPQALLYLAGGQYLVIAAQVLLAVMAILWVREIGLRVGLGAGQASAAAALYGVLPHTLVFPHQLASEAIFVPFVVLSFALATRTMGTKAQAGGGAAMGAATFVRPVTMLWPFLYAAFVRATPRARVAYLLTALAPLAVWIGFIHATTGEWSMGRSSHDLGHNLYLRVERMAAHLPPAARPEAKPPAERRVSVVEYFRFVLDHPRVAAAHSARDLAVLGFKSGLNRLVLDYLDLFPKSRERLQDSASGWRVQVERHGLLRGLAAILKASPALTLTSLAGALLFAFFMGLAALGAYAWLRDTSIAPATRRLRILLIVFVLYIIATAQVVDAAQSRHRHPAEFALCLIAVAGLPLLTHRRRRRHGA